MQKLSPDLESSAPTNEQIVDAIANVNPDVVLRNLAFWLDVAIARGRWYDHISAQNALSKSEADNQPEV